MATSTDKTIKLLTAYVIVLTLVCIYLAFAVFKATQRNKAMDELTVKRINVVDESGQRLRLVISNETRQHPGRPNGKDLPPRSRPAGLLFFNNDGDECGGLVYSVDRENGSTSSGASLTMDQLHSDQVVQLSNDELYDATGKGRPGRRGLSVNTIPMGTDMGAAMEKYNAYKKIADPAERKRKIRQLMIEEGVTNRMFVGLNEKGEYGMFLFDSAGRYRFKICVDPQGNPQVQVADTAGRLQDFYPGRHPGA